MNIAIITGASSGIGKEFAKQIDNYNLDELWLIARRKDKLSDLKKFLKTKSEILSFDLEKKEDIEKLNEILKNKKPTVKILVNSAGVGMNGDFSQTNLKYHNSTIDLNIKALVDICYLTIFYMNKGSKIINIASVAGLIPQPNFSTYSASKAFVISFSRSLNRELRKKKIKVSCLLPNQVETEFLKKSNNESKVKSFGKENIQKLVDFALKKSEKKDIIVYSFISKTLKVISKILPHSFIMWIEKILKFY